MYKIINDKLTQTQETGTKQEIDAVYTDEKGIEIPIKISVPIITFQEVSPDPISQVIENMNYDLNRLRDEINGKIAEYNKKANEALEIKKDIPEIGLTTDIIAEIA